MMDLFRFFFFFSYQLRWHEKILDYALIGGYGFLVEATRGEFDNCK